MQLGTSLSSRRASDAITEIEIRIEPRLVLGYLLTAIRVVPVQDEERKKHGQRICLFFVARRTFHAKISPQSKSAVVGFYFRKRFLSSALFLAKLIFLAFLRRR